MRILALLIIFSSLQFDIFGQDSTLTKVRDQLEAAFEEIEDDDAGEQLIQFLQDLENNPVNINTADITDLIQIPGLSFVAAKRIIIYREENLFRNKEDLLKVRGIGQVTYQKYHRISLLEMEEKNKKDSYLTAIIGSITQNLK